MHVQVRPFRAEDIEQTLGLMRALAEFEGDTVTEVTLTLAPDSSDELSTFAGLGLT